MGKMHTIKIEPIAPRCDHVLEKDIVHAISEAVKKHGLYVNFTRSHVEPVTYVDIVAYDQQKVLDIQKGNLTELLRAQAKEMGISVDELVQQAIGKLKKDV